jgi:hypothetical protein
MLALLQIPQIPDDEAALEMLNRLESLLYDRFPPSLAADTDALETALLGVARRYPLGSGHVEDLVARLRHITSTEEDNPGLTPSADTKKGSSDRDGALDPQ